MFLLWLSFIFWELLQLFSFNIGKIPGTIALILTSAFSPVAAVGGFAGASIRMAIQNGVARGVFSNESGLGSAPIAAAAAKTNEPVEQGLISMTGTFIDTLIICTLTGLTILVTGVWSGDLNGVALTQSAFSTVFSHFGPALLTIFLVLFAFTTILVGTITGNVVLSFSLAFALSGSIEWSLCSWSCWEDLSSWIWSGLLLILSTL